jgi:drug/metabolite transporter (DMT)-like permease
MSKPLPASVHAANRKSIIAMLISQALFTANDACVKLATETLPLGQVMALRNGSALICIIACAGLIGGLRPPSAIPMRPFGFRLGCEILATLLFFVAISRMPIADLTAIGQFTPLGITAAGALFLAEPVGWRRWLAAIVGLIGVLLVIKPGSSTFSWVSIIAVLAVTFGIGRDLATRVVGPLVPNALLTLSSLAAVLIMGLALMPFETWKMPDLREILLMAACGVLLTTGYIFLNISLQTGDLAAASPFRSSAVLWALIAGFLVWGHLPDQWSLAGIALIVGAGLYALHREQLKIALAD